MTTLCSDSALSFREHLRLRVFAMPQEDVVSALEAAQPDDQRWEGLMSRASLYLTPSASMESVFVVGPDKKIKLMLVYPMSTGRNFDEVLRVLDSMQLTSKHQVATPVNWKNGEDVIILPAVNDEAAKAKYPDGWKSPKPYLRIVPCPK